MENYGQKWQKWGGRVVWNSGGETKRGRLIVRKIFDGLWRWQVVASVSLAQAFFPSIIWSVGPGSCYRVVPRVLAKKLLTGPLLLDLRYVVGCAGHLSSAILLIYSRTLHDFLFLLLGSRPASSHVDIERPNTSCLCVAVPELSLDVTPNNPSD
jgi:hypothetical protein